MNVIALYQKTNIRYTNNDQSLQIAFYYAKIA